MTVVSVAQKGWWQFEENKWETFSGSYQIRKLTHIDAKTVIWKWLIVAPAASQHPLLSAALSHHCFVLLVYSTFVVCLHGTSDRPFVRPSVELCKFCYSERRIAFIDLVWLVNRVDCNSTKFEDESRRLQLCAPISCAVSMKTQNKQSSAGAEGNSLIEHSAIAVTQPEH